MPIPYDEWLDNAHAELDAAHLEAEIMSEHCLASIAWSLLAISRMMFYDRLEDMERRRDDGDEVAEAS